MINVKDIYSLSEFQRKTREHIRRLKESRRPAVLTINGKAELVVQDAESYQALLEALEEAETLAGIRAGLDSAARGEGRSLRDALEELRKRHDIRRLE